jgi:hypothetical protein
MVLTLIFIILFVATAVAWQGKRDMAIYIFAISFVMAVATFIHHMTDIIGLSL